jgi:hAT family C-terminal dimerisation region
MASSVSSERAFSAAGITITKRRNRLKHDIVEALQFLKCVIRQELLFREPAPSSLDEMVFEEVEEADGDSEWEDVVEPGWDLSLDVDDEDEATEPLPYMNEGYGEDDSTGLGVLSSSGARGLFCTPSRAVLGVEE